MTTHAAGYDYTRTGKPDIVWDDQDAKDGLITALVTDALALLAAVDPETLEGKAADAYAPRWPSLPGRMWNRPMTPTAPTGGGGSRGKSPRTG